MVVTLLSAAALIAVNLLFVAGRQSVDVQQTLRHRAKDGSSSEILLPLSLVGSLTLWGYVRRARRKTEPSPDSSEVKLVSEDEVTVMRNFVGAYARKTGTRLARHREIPERVIRGLAENKKLYGAPLCPCRSYEDPKKEVKRGHMNCPCEPMRKEKKCHCLLFLPEDHLLVDASDVLDW
jgi:ferredoxin-thioredoxin reductase catalytic chain